MKFKNSQRGFTIVELMVVVAIIGILSGIIITSLTGSKAKSRDARRVSDVNQIQLALEQYFDRCGQYPTTLATTSNNGCPVDPGTSQPINLGYYISIIPTPPSNATAYDYANNSSVSTYGPTDYVLHTQLENSNVQVQQNSLQSLPTGISGSNCYNPAATPGSTGYLDYCIGTK